MRAGAAARAVVLAGAAARAGAVVLAGAAALGAGCSLLVPGEPTDVRCTEEGAIGPPVCPTGTFCLGGACVEGPPALGEPCGMDGVCAPGDRCFDPASVGLTGPEICSHPCCSSADCGAGTDLVCAVLGPGKMCVPASAWGRVLPGAGFAGDACDVGAECRSGECTDGRTCADTCCSDAECGLSGGVCRDDGAGWMCRPAPASSKAYLEECADGGECASGLCLEWPDGARRCGRPCCSSDECGTVKMGGSIRSVLCVQLQHGAAIVHACAAVAEGDADRALGEPCDEPGQCRGGRCVEAGASGGKVCSDVCCTDASCGAPHLFACAPVLDPGQPLPGAPPGQGFAMQCVPR